MVNLTKTVKEDVKALLALITPDLVIGSMNLKNVTESSVLYALGMPDRVIYTVRVDDTIIGAASILLLTPTMVELGGWIATKYQKGYGREALMQLLQEIPEKIELIVISHKDPIVINTFKKVGFTLLYETNDEASGIHEMVYAIRRH